VQVQFGANFGAETVQFFAEWSYGKKEVLLSDTE